MSANTSGESRSAPAVRTSAGVSTFCKDNHYVPQHYLKRWTTNGKLWVYRVLVSHPHVRKWRQSSTKSVAWREHLYTRLAAGLASDDLERWLSSEFEAPAEEAIQKVVNEHRLTQRDWQQLVRFAACQHVRTPARLIEFITRWSSQFEPLLNRTLRNSVKRLEDAKRDGIAIVQTNIPYSDHIPVRVTTHIEPGAELGTIRAEAIVGRGMWLFGIRHLLTSTVQALLKNKWTILSPPDGIEWITSDDPVIPLNYYGDGRYDFKGGWGNPGSEIILPLGPKHMMYTMVGKRSRYRETVSLEMAQTFRRFMAEHAHRYVFALKEDPELELFRPRIVDATAVRDETAQWEKWHEEQSLAEH